MNSRATYSAIFIAGALVSWALLAGFRQDVPPPAEPHAIVREVVVPREKSQTSHAALDGDFATRMERRLNDLVAQLEAESNDRRQLEARLETLSSELAAVRAQHGAAEHAQAEHAGAPPRQEDAEQAGAPVQAADNGEDTSSPMERALRIAGVEESVVLEIKRRHDEIALNEVYLRDLASREGWLDTPRFAEELAQIKARELSVRTEIGDDAYDRYLAALDHPNRVAVHEVLLDSPAAAAGLQNGDLILRYGDSRIFALNELVQATRGGIAGEPVRVEVVRQGRQLEIEVPRGPLGIRIAATHVK